MDKDLDSMIDEFVESNKEYQLEATNNFNPYDVDKNQDDEQDILSWQQDLPYFNAGQMLDMGVFSNLRYYNTEPDNTLISEKVTSEQWYTTYKAFCSGFFTEEFNEYNILRVRRLRQLYSDYDKIIESKDEEKINKRKQSILELGWNPEIDFTVENRMNVTKYKIQEMKDNNFKLKKSHINEYYEMKDNEVVSEAKEFPVGFDKDGNLLIKNWKSIDYNIEFSKSSKLLKAYEETNNIEVMKYELAKLWFLNSLLEDKIYNKNDKNKAELQKTRNTILNTFSKYIRIVCSKEEQFNFTEYYNNTPFSDKAYKISHNTLKYGIKILKSIF